jgi:hypothetical protein
MNNSEARRVRRGGLFRQKRLGRVIDRFNGRKYPARSRSLPSMTFAIRKSKKPSDPRKPRQPRHAISSVKQYASAGVTRQHKVTQSKPEMQITY